MSHCERLLEALADGEWHDHHELYGLHMIVHSRVADLRRQGHTVERRRNGDLYEYRLLPAGNALDTTPAAAGCRLERAATVADPASPPGMRGGALDSQLTLDGVAA